MERLIGKIIHYYSNLGVGIVELFDTLKLGDEIHIKGKTTDFEQKVDSIQIEHKPVEEGKTGEVVGIKVKDKVREGDEVYLKIP